ncbi:MAG: sigma 54-interacting transcriptional regulator [Clostridium sp.]|uniref:sigma 54-interacting transcriptional regulator n=1 Tax=Clostridium sp. TaxID=1506 RepID=UPI003EE51CF6
MKRIHSVYKTVKELDLGDGVTTLSISKKLNIERANISKDLNTLVKDGLLFKNSSRPVKYFLKDPNDLDFNQKSPLDNLTFLFPSLTDSCKLAKTAILYPPSGMNSIIIGETGSGKSMLAKLMHDYAKSVFHEDMPFYHFNCSDFRNNPQLLSSHLFGVKKGTFTGATEDRIGLIEKANNGILFLDEIHNLPSEGQEMLFIFMDTGTFRKFGEVSKTSKSNVRIICATNEDINKTLLSTFLRRISVKIQMPPLTERPLEERLTLIETFLKEESMILNMPVSVSYNAMLCFLSYDCPFNVGQLKNDIKLSVANAYTDYIIKSKKLIKINSPDLTKDMRKNLSRSLVREKILLENLVATNRYYIYNEDTQITSHYFKHKTEDIFKAYKTLINRVDILASTKNLSPEPLIEALLSYFTVLSNCTLDYDFNFSYSLFDDINAKLTSFDKNFERFFREVTLENLFNIHLDLIYDRMGFLSSDDFKVKDKFRRSFPTEFALAEEYVSIIEDSLNLYFSSSEFITILLITIYIYNSNLT